MNDHETLYKLVAVLWQIGTLKVANVSIAKGANFLRFNMIYLNRQRGKKKMVIM